MDNTQAQPFDALSFCSGYGGIELGLRQAGLRISRCVYVEREAYAIKVLEEKIESGELAAGVIHTDVSTFPAHKFRGSFDAIFGGFPCQPFSVASSGKNKADEDERHIFPAILNAIRIIQPRRFVLLENVEGIVSAKLRGDQWADPAGTPVLLHVLRELERVGLRVEAGIFSAETAGASHERRRIFILGTPRSQSAGDATDHWFRPWRGEIGNHPFYQSVADTKGVSAQGTNNEDKRREISEDRVQSQLGRGNLPDGTFPSLPGDPPRIGEEPKTYQPELVRAVDGTPGWVDPIENARARFGMIGNGVCPQTAAQAFTYLMKKMK